MDDPTVIKFPLTSGRHDPKHTVVPEILEQHPWHWDPMMKDHGDDWYLTNYADEAFEALNTEVAIEEILIDETEPQLSLVEDDESLAYNIQ